MNGRDAVEVRNLLVRYGGIVALENVDLSVRAGQALGIIGPNGSGKSTLLKAIAGLLTPDAGTVRVFGVAPRELPPGTVGYVPQIEDVDWAFPVSVRDVVGMGRFPRLGLVRRSNARDYEKVGEALESLGISALAPRQISELSGGQRQRVFVARALAQEPRLLLLDEPATGVDAATEDKLLEIVRRLAGEGMPIVMTTHDLDRAPEWFDRLAVVDRKIVAVGEPREILATEAYHGLREHAHIHGHSRT
ncbi:MAG: metal ABC transporter ATP-binding protein [Candidatus Eremiobacteraeota bacterium]|nr:metal ABC transporter ATP-binding protein [Candidatus Eremiobacteraeota bacterium]MBV8356148.1 metal ABC transporter ATP-binding protein [Candidatus Eremiobacteraeota bacterium]